MIQGIVNATIEAAGECHAEKRRAAELMETVVRPNLIALSKQRLVVVPLPEHGILHYLDRVWDRWPNNIRNGIIAFDDMTCGNAEQTNPLLRFTNESRVSFKDKIMFCNGIFNGRYFIWIDFPTAFMTVDVLDFTSFGCMEDNVAPVFGCGLSSMVEQFSAYASQLRIDEERDYRMEVAALYGDQWALAHP